MECTECSSMLAYANHLVQGVLWHPYFFLCLIGFKIYHRRELGDCLYVKVKIGTYIN